LFTKFCSVLKALFISVSKAFNLDVFLDFFLDFFLEVLDLLFGFSVESALSEACIGVTGTGVTGTGVTGTGDVGLVKCIMAALLLKGKTTELHKANAFFKLIKKKIVYDDMERFIPDMKTKQTINFLGGDRLSETTRQRLGFLCTKNARCRIWARAWDASVLWTVLWWR
jgi:hypothetical protein